MDDTILLLRVHNASRSATLLSVTKQTARSSDVLGNILKKLTAKRSRARVVDKLLSIGLVSDRRQLYKKRSSGAHRKSSGKGMVRLQMFLCYCGGAVELGHDEISVCVVGTVKVNDNSLLKCICVCLKYDIILGGWSTIKGFLFLYESLHCGWTKYNDEAQDKAYNDINHNQINNDFQWVFERGIIIIGNCISCLKL